MDKLETLVLRNDVEAIRSRLLSVSILGISIGVAIVFLVLGVKYAY